ncbi:MAG: hydrogenase formation protein HypD [Clostridiales Family XIII bacterium]|jgi:hydrogenase expression/formation protein HypD|nr:hydrogenase formation protein HypD [Clostridiales Family XIII bacterium]
MKIEAIISYLKNYGGPEIRIMEVCGTHTAAIFKNGIRSLLPPAIRLVSGPGCPVCVTPAAYIDRCVAYAVTPGHAVFSFGDMMKVPGTEYSLAGAKGAGGRVEIMYSPPEIVSRAKNDPETVYVLAAVGFETTAPAYALALEEAAAAGVKNLRLVTALKSAVPALRWISESEDGIDGFICPGHVSVITGARVFAELEAEYGKPFVVSGFEGEHILAAVYRIVRFTEDKRSGADASPAARNLYPSAVTEEGNRRAQQYISKYFETGAAVWRGLGAIAGSGFYLKAEYAGFDGGSRGLDRDRDLPAGCRCGDVVTGRTDPDGCPMFGKECRPEHPFGPCMVSAEGACGIWHQNREVHK